ncbi:hypothetical protein [Blautia sp. Marseille-P3087]|uniref:hypothetical protein n=1 Tax=Blautia sp. Marseille-P3087 TaxID=1917876 RepID=UPI000930DAB8|nr:hypothetical protein [Blautia sp. Marseille-P3087]
MGETYARLYSLPERLYTMGAPVVVAAGALLKDNRNGNIIVQLKIQNICSKTIKAVTVKITSIDTVGRTLGEETEYQYLDLNVKRNEFLGQQVPIIVPNEQTRSYSVKVTEAAFDDNTVWAGNEIWEPLEKPDPIEKKIANGELARQYRIKYGKNSKYLLKQDRDLWFCTCGAINHESELSCCSCHIDRKKLEELDVDALKKECDARLEDERKERERKQAEAAVEAKKKQKKIKMIVVGVAAAVAVAAVGVVIKDNLNKKKLYNQGLALLEDEKYDDSIALLESLNGYKDSKEQIIYAEYQKAVKYEKSGEYEEALALYEELGDYEDSKEKYKEVQYKLHPAKKLCEYVRENGTSSDFEMRGNSHKYTGVSMDILVDQSGSDLSADDKIYITDSDDDQFWVESVLTKEGLYIDIILHFVYNANGEGTMEYTYYFEQYNIWKTADEQYDGRGTISGQTSIASYQKDAMLTVDNEKMEVLSDPENEIWQTVTLTEGSSAESITSTVAATFNSFQYYLENNTDITMKDLGFNLKEEDQREEDQDTDTVQEEAVQKDAAQEDTSQEEGTIKSKDDFIAAYVDHTDADNDYKSGYDYCMKHMDEFKDLTEEELSAVFPCRFRYYKVNLAVGGTTGAGDLYEYDAEGNTRHLGRYAADDSYRTREDINPNWPEIDGTWRIEDGKLIRTITSGNQEKIYTVKSLERDGYYLLCFENKSGDVRPVMMIVLYDENDMPLYDFKEN